MAARSPCQMAAHSALMSVSSASGTSGREEFTQYQVVRSFALTWHEPPLCQAKRYRTAVQVAERKSWQ